MSTELVADLELDVDVRQRQRVAERDELGRPLRGHDPGEPAPSTSASPLGSALERAGRLGRHADARRGPGATRARAAWRRRRPCGRLPTRRRGSAHRRSRTRGDRRRRRSRSADADVLGLGAERFHVKTHARRPEPARPGDRARRRSASRSESSRTSPPMRRAISRAIERPSPLPDAMPPSTR